ncbi:MAG: BNR-4 repeat-containing protein, partial [Lentisphaeria bacterium]|nr:BNR-4 repeat-containing protein [Lentisphaeria bacterium]
SYPTDNQMYFDGANRPYVASSRSVVSRHGEAWRRVGMATPAGAKAKTAFSLRSTKIAFDSDDGVYALGTVKSKPVLLHSADHGETFASYVIETNGGFDIEQFSGHNTPVAPPPFVRFTRTKKDPKLKWRSLNDLCLYVPEKQGDKIVVGDPILLSRSCIGLSNHSGIPSSIVSRGSKVHVTWGEATDPADKMPGVPTRVVTYDRETRTLGESVLIGFGPPANDVHNSPCITMDSRGFLHVLVGTHGRTFKYARSLKPNDAEGGWTETENVGKGLRQTYVGLVCDRDDTLHLVFRLWCSDRAVQPAGYYASLAHMSKRPGEPWSEARPLVCAPFTDYSIFYHRLGIDRLGRIFLSYTYWSTYWFYRMDGPRGRALILSPDSGKTWKLATDSDLNLKN